MRPELQREYERVLTAVVLRHGRPTWAPGSRPSPYSGAVDYHNSEHVRACSIVTTGRVDEEVEWSEFSGTFASTDACRRQGVSVEGVTCACGQLTNRTILWEASIQDVAQAVFAEMHRQLHPNEEIE